MPASIKLLLDGIIDYAGTFPPASLPLQEALSSYTAARRSAENWLLGRLVRHRQRGSDLLYEAWAVDIGGGD